ncbi:MFS transporter [Athalassotoga sp.]|uniref:MFS transporter n=1 Tax=Athalassotoga sp. TaxID=2022597 RepID=UPI003D086A81
MAKWLNRNLSLLMMSRFLRSVAQASLTILVPIYLSKLGFSGVQIGLAFTLSVIVGILFSIGVGFFADKHGRKLVILVMTIINAISVLGFFFTTSYIPLMLFVSIGTIRGGGGGGAAGAAQQALIAESANSKFRNDVFGTFSFFGAIGSTIGYALTIILPYISNVFKDGWRGGYLFLMAIAFVIYISTFFITLFVQEDKNRPKRQNTFKLSWKLLGKFSLTNAVNGLGTGFFSGPILVYWFFVRYGAGIDLISVIYVLSNIARAISSISSARVAKFFGTVKTIVGVRTIGAIMLVFMALMPTFFLAGLFYLLRMFFVSAGIPLRQSFTMGQTKEEERASMAALSNLPQQITSSIGPTASGYFMDYSMMEAPIFIAAIFQFANAALYWHFFKKSD